MLTALRRQLQPHLVMALQGHKNATYPQLQVTIIFDMNSVVINWHFWQAANFANFLPTGGSPGGGSVPEADSDEESIADLPLNLVSTQMTETESHWKTKKRIDYQWYQST